MKKVSQWWSAGRFFGNLENRVAQKLLPFGAVTVRFIVTKAMEVMILRIFRTSGHGHGPQKPLFWTFKLVPRNHIGPNWSHQMFHDNPSKIQII